MHRGTVQPRFEFYRTDPEASEQGCGRARVAVFGGISLGQASAKRGKLGLEKVGTNIVYLVYWSTYRLTIRICVAVENARGRCAINNTALNLEPGTMLFCPSWSVIHERTRIGPEPRGGISLVASRTLLVKTTLSVIARLLYVQVV